MASGVPEAAAHPIPLVGNCLDDQSVAARVRRALRRWSAEASARADAERQHEVSGSAMVAEQPSTPDDIAVNWTSSVDTTAQPTLTPSEPRPVGSAERDPGDPT
jgi:hypothetical protein